jgi:hypothetical protein
VTYFGITVVGEAARLVIILATHNPSRPLRTSYVEHSMSEEAEPELDSCIEALKNDESLLDIATSEQELIEAEFLRFFEEITEKFRLSLEDMNQQHTSEVCSLDSESTPVDVQQLLLADIRSWEKQTFQRISVFLDGRFTKFRRSFQAYKKATLDKLFIARQSIVQYKKSIEISSQVSAQIQMRLRIEESEAKQAAQIADLLSSSARYQSAYEMASSKGTALEMERMAFLENISRLEGRLKASEDRADRVSRLPWSLQVIFILL